MFEVEIYRPAVSKQVAAIISDLSELVAQLGALTLEGAWSGPLAEPAHRNLEALQISAQELVTEGQALLRLSGAEESLFRDVNAAVAQAHVARVAAAGVGVVAP